VINSIRETSRRILRLLVKDDCAGSSRFAQEVKSYWEDNPERLQARFYSRVRLKQNVFASLIDWLAWTGWESGIDARPALCVGVQRILAQLARRDEAGDTPSQLQAGSLVARYLILLEATGVDARDRLAVLNATRVRIQSDCLHIGRRHPGRTRDVGDVRRRRTVLGSLTILTDSGPIKLGAVLECEGSNLCGLGREKRCTVRSLTSATRCRPLRKQKVRELSATRWKAQLSRYFYLGDKQSRSRI
jgi:hypothetical protein